MISWGLRMALSGTLPVIWGLSTGNLNDAIWITLTAEAVTWVEMKGSFSWRLRTLLLGAVLAIFFAMLGTATAGILWISLLCMLGTGFFATLLKSMGDRASGLALCVYLMFIICNGFPVAGYAQLQHRFALVSIGGAWPVVVGVFISLLMPAGEPFRRQIALIWRSIAELADTIAQNKGGRHSEVYVREKDVRTAIDNSYQFYGKMAHQVNQKDNRHYQLAVLRKVAGLVSVNVLAMGEELEHIAISELDEALRIKTGTAFNIMIEAINRISVFVITLKPEEKLLAVSQINRLKKFNDMIRQFPLQQNTQQNISIKRIIQLTDRTIRLLENAIQRIDNMGTDVPVYQSYSFIKTLFVLRPKYMLRNLQLLFNFNTLTTRYAIRSAIAATVAMAVYMVFHIDHGYWLPFTVMIVIQPYFGATLKKAIDRIIGTLAGGIIGSLIFLLPVGLHIKEVILFLSFIFMVYYIRKNYAVAVFIVTLNLVLLFNIEAAFSNTLMVYRALCTTGGAMLAIFSGFALLPDWDKKWLPAHLAAALRNNYSYFLATFYSAAPVNNWTKLKRLSESNNSDVFDSFNRYITEPGSKNTELYYSIITTNVRTTRNLNNIHLEQDETKKDQTKTTTLLQQKRILECHSYFTLILNNLPGSAISDSGENTNDNNLPSITLNEAQMHSLEKLAIELKTLSEDVKLLAKS